MEASTPYFEFSADSVHQQLRAFRAAFGDPEIYYALKANSEVAMIEAVLEDDGGFEAASWPEIELLLSLGVSPQRIIFGTAVKARDAVVRASASGLTRFAADSIEEIELLAYAAPKSEVFVRAIVDDSQAVFHMTGSGKFGAPVELVPGLVRSAIDAGLVPLGVSFHVGSQSLDVDAWARGVATVAPAVKELDSAGIRLPYLNLGGGFPTSYRDVDAPSIAAIAESALGAVEGLPYKPRLLIEPGRALAAESMVLVTSVISRVERTDGPWLYLDAGVYNALFEAMVYQGTTQYPVVLERDGSATSCRYTLAGPTGDGIDTIARGVELPADIRAGDRLRFLTTGAYTTALAAPFNGFAVPPIHLGANLAGHEATPQSTESSGSSDVGFTVESRLAIGFPAEREQWNESPALFTGTTLRIAGHPVMEDWEQGYMSQLAQIAASSGGDILEVGYGLGLSCAAVQARHPRSHTVIECHPDVIGRCLTDQRHAIAGGTLHLATGFWQDVVKYLAPESFDGILFDTYPLAEEEIHRNHWDFFEEAFRLLRPGGVLTYYSDEVESLSPEHLGRLQDAGFDEARIKVRVCPVTPPDDCEYWTERTIVAPIVLK